MKNILVFLFAFIILIVSSCTKKGSVKPSTTDSIIVKSNVFVIDTTKLTLVSTPDQLSQGIYVFTTNSTFPDFVQNGIIVGSTGEGYVRKITSVTGQSGQVTLNTSQASLEDVFQQATFTFGSDFSALQRTSHTTDNGFQYNLSNITLYQNGPLTITLTSGSIAINPNWHFTCNYQNGSVFSFSALCQNGSLNANMNINVSASQSISVSQSDTIKEATSTTIEWIDIIPIVITTHLYLIVNISGTLSASINQYFTVNNSDSFNLGATYSGGVWQNVYSFTPTTTINSAPGEGHVGLLITCSLVPEMDIILEGIVGPYASLPLNEYLAGNLASPALDWDFTAGAFLQPTIGVAASILGHSLGNYSHSWYSDTIIYKTPYQINKISGNNQIGIFGQQLPLPLKVQVLDNNGFSQSNVPVYFSIAQGGGNVLPTEILTDANGYAETQWTIGLSGIQSVQVTTKWANGGLINGAPLIFKASEDTLHIGEIYGGGIVAYILKPGDPGFDSSVQHGLIAAPTDQTPPGPYGCYGVTIVGASGTSLGTGQANTAAIVSECSGSAGGCAATGGSPCMAAIICHNLTLGGHTDWYLPSKDELNKLYINQSVLGTFTSYAYWSSSVDTGNTAWAQNISTGNQEALNQDLPDQIRAVRAF